MYKALVLIKRKPGISREAFIQHYEEVHAPLALKHLPMIRRYVRNHIVHMRGTEGLDFDCITELWFDSIEDAARLFEYVQSDAGRVIRDDEENFMDRHETRSLVVEEKVSDIQG